MVIYNTAYQVYKHHLFVCCQLITDIKLKNKFVTLLLWSY
jgi:hypothetical protein